MPNIKWLIALGFLSTFILLYLHIGTSIDKWNTQPHPQTNQNKQIGDILIYNRIPKTGSTSLMNVAYELQSSNRYRVVQVRLLGSRHLLSPRDQQAIARNISAWSDLPMLLHGHFSYFEASVLGLDINPVFINLMRKPLDRLVSYYYFLRYGDDILVDKKRSKQGDKTTFDECVESSQPDCAPKKMWMQIPFFCGSSPACWDPGSKWALDQAKTNLVNKYLVVGVTEDLDSFVQVLEILLPKYFSGAVQYLKDTGKSHIKRTKHKDQLSEQTISKMSNSKIYQMEMEFYNFAMKQFKWIKKSLVDDQSNGFVYEKIRPKP